MTAAEELVITLPDSDTIMERLREVCDEDHLREYFYTLIAAYSGKLMSAQDILEVFEGARHHYFGRLSGNTVALASTKILLRFYRAHFVACLSSDPAINSQLLQIAETWVEPPV